MPNHVRNLITFSGDQPRIKSIIERLKRQFEDGGCGFDFNKLIPMPESLSLESGSRTDAALAIYRWANMLDYTDNSRFNDKRFHEDLLKERISKAGLNWCSKEDLIKYANDNEIDLSIGEKAYNNIMEHGSKDWYEWCPKHWGTKWNAYDNEFGSDYVKFSTAWNAPEPIIKKLSEMFPEIDFIWEYADEDTGHNTGLYESRNGKLYYHEVENKSSEAYELYIKLHGESKCIYKDEDGNWQHYECGETCPHDGDC